MHSGMGAPSGIFSTRGALDLLGVAMSVAIPKLDKGTHFFEISAGLVRKPYADLVGEEKANMVRCVGGRRTQTSLGNTDGYPGGAAAGGLELGRTSRRASVRKRCDHCFGCSGADYANDRSQVRK